MKLSKKIIQNRVARKLLCFFAANYIRFVYLTSHWTVIRGDIPKKFWEKDKKFLLCFWHGRLLMMPHCWNVNKPIHMMISMHEDGRLISDTVARLGIRTIAGSTSKGGVSALRSMVRTVRNGEYVGLTPDGPRGPRMRAQEGIVTIARLANIPVIPVGYASTNSKALGSWDRFITTFPFGRGVFVWGEPIEVPQTTDKFVLEKTRQKIENATNAVTNEADRFCGLDPIKPASITAEETIK